jgi:hypothetical protein
MALISLWKFGLYGRRGYLCRVEMRESLWKEELILIHINNTQ